MNSEASNLSITRIDDHELRVGGDIDAHSAERLKQPLADLAAKHTRLDMSGVTFIDSSGLRELVLAHQHAVEAGGSIVVVSPSATVRRLLDITSVAEILEIE